MTGLGEAPEMRLNSANRCPHAGIDHLLGTDCNPDALTLYGYCGYCWHNPARIPQEWKQRVKAHMDWIEREVRDNPDERERRTEGATVIQFPRRGSRVGVGEPRPAG